MERDVQILKFPNKPRQNRSKDVWSYMDTINSGVIYLIDKKNQREFELTYEVAELVGEWWYDKHDSLVSEILSIWWNREKKKVTIEVSHKQYSSKFCVELNATESYDNFRQTLYYINAHFDSSPKDDIAIQIVWGWMYYQKK